MSLVLFRWWRCNAFCYGFHGYLRTRNPFYIAAWQYWRCVLVTNEDQTLRRTSYLYPQIRASLINSFFFSSSVFFYAFFYSFWNINCIISKPNTMKIPRWKIALGSAKKRQQYLRCLCAIVARARWTDIRSLSYPINMGILQNLQYESCARAMILTRHHVLNSTARDKRCWLSEGQTYWWERSTWPYAQQRPKTQLKE